MASSSSRGRRYVCGACGATYGYWLGQCQACGAWNRLEEQSDSVAQRFGSVGKKGSGAGAGAGVQGDMDMVTVSQNSAPSEQKRYTCGIDEFDRVCGGGLVTGGVVLVGGAPGIGKSTLMMQLAHGLSRHHKTVYISGEESVEQVAARARRLGCDGAFMVAHANGVHKILHSLEKSKDLRCLILDSVQSFYVEGLESAAGTINQVRAVASVFIEFARSRGICVLFVGHVTKDGGLAGPKLLEHMVDTVLYFEHEFKDHLRVLRVTKNRYGASHELGFFEMTTTGLRQVVDPSLFFLSDHREGVAGCALFPSMEGGRSIVLEIQALVARTSFGLPRRSAIGFDLGRLLMILAVLEAKCGLSFGGHDIYVNVVGGMKVRDAAGDVAVAAAVLSALSGRALPSGVVFCGEIGLSGEIRDVTRTALRLQEAQKRGFRGAFVPEKATKKVKTTAFRFFSLTDVVNMVELLGIMPQKRAGGSRRETPTVTERQT
ncbi:MAG: DNA repair protein RadA [Alphaproteobacteria bacterium GM202ARS2]|nr:DNA repair protein RadA [Alphaproteobacteria bacterium GM202ARS2]